MSAICATATSSIRERHLKMKFPQVHLLPHTPQLTSMLTIVRNKETSHEQFVFYADRINRLLVEEALNLLPTKPAEVRTPLEGVVFQGTEFEKKICAVSIIRAGESMEKAVRETCLGIRIGKVLIQRNEETAEPIVYYQRLPADVHERQVLILEPMLATGGSAIEAIRILLEHGVPQENIIFVNVVSAPEGLERVFKEFPRMSMVCASIDEGMNAKKYIVPGLGDYGDRYFGTEI
ncbi:MAG: hypothetical protein KVP17_003978 [Porospora cf. gigantea B]|uniref:uncharacterized protein n=2 Tax=Porospora cf. gigantea B TaxID=2853592 RepID=UPI003571E931|nr:MAG: hypothetical protein KVP17_003978 [Porospora cf. gigantea B]